MVRKRIAHVLFENTEPKVENDYSSYFDFLYGAKTCLKFYKLNIITVLLLALY